MYCLTEGGLNVDTNASIWYFVNGFGDTWLSPKQLERMLMLDEELTDLAKGAETDEQKKEVEAKILDIFKKKYLYLLWKKFNSIKGLITEYVVEKSKTKEWEDESLEQQELPDEPSEIKFKKYK